MERFLWMFPVTPRWVLPGPPTGPSLLQFLVGYRWPQHPALRLRLCPNLQKHLRDRYPDFSATAQSIQ